jgi:6-phosphogluconolactonase (cycloisomerase 2 family)
VTANGAFTFTTPVTINGSYNVTVGTQPTAMGCRVFSGSGSSVTANVTSVNVTCRTEVAYVVNNGSATISQYTIGVGGALATLGSPVSTGLDPRAMAVDPSGRYVYVPNYGDGTVSQYNIGADGSLTAMSPASVPTGSGATSSPTFVAIDPTGRYVYVTNGADGTVSQFTISTTVGTAGQLISMSTPTITTIGGLPLFITVDPTGKFAYVANAGSQSVAQYGIGVGGALTALSPATVAIGSPTSELFGITIDPTGSYAYVGDYSGNAIFQFTIGGTGSLSPTPGAPTVTAPLVAGPYPMVIDSTGQYALWSNTLDTPAPTLSQCAIGAGGFLINCSKATPAPGQQARYIAIDPTGRFAYVANHGDNTVSQYTIGSGAVLAPIAPPTAGTGANPTFVTTTWTR